jgi:hypothetical protein
MTADEEGAAKLRESREANGSLEDWLAKFGQLAKRYLAEIKDARAAREGERNWAQDARDKEYRAAEVMGLMVAMMRQRCGPELVEALATLARLPRPDGTHDEEKADKDCPPRYSGEGYQGPIDLGEEVP